jgi:sporulation integral membrane protein YlbJ
MLIFKGDKKLSRSQLKTLVLASAITIISISLISFPQESVNASRQGLTMWWEIVFPSLLPFFIICELLISFGVVGFIGVLLEPLMRPLFKIPGVGGFVWALGMASGFPTGAKLTAKLRQEGQLTKIEAERLVSFTNSSNPLFIFGAVAVVFFENAQLGLILALAHYLGNICIGLIMRFYGQDQEVNCTQKQRSFSMKHALKVLHQTRLKEQRPFGKLLGDAVISSINTLLMVGGFIILFAVINELLFHLYITQVLGSLISNVFTFIQLPSTLTIPFISGLLEITTGSHLTSKIQEINLMHQAIIVSFILAFSGFSVQAQVASILAPTDISFKPFFIARIIHGFLASIITFFLWDPVYNNFSRMSDQLSHIPAMAFAKGDWIDGRIILFMMKIGPIVTIMALAVYIVIFSKRMNKN